jgi:cobalamin biosynthesis protein CobT
MADRLSDGTLSAARKKSIAKAPLVESRYHARLDDDVVEDIEPFDHADGVNQFVESVRAVVPTLRRRLLMEFRGVGTRREFNKKRGEVDRESLHKVAVGNPRVFTQDTPHEVPGADVTLLVDASGSMMCYGGRGAAGSRIYVASQAAYAFSQVLDLIKVPNEVLAFTTEVHYDIEACAHHRSEGGAYTRVRPLRHMVVKPEGTSFRSRKAHFARLAYFDRCAENIDGEGVMWAARRLAARNRAGMAPILIVFSDGAPASVPESMSLLSWHLKHTVQRVEKSGIHVIGVGIQTDSVKRFFKNHLMISDVSDLVGTSYSILRAVLRKATRVR